MHDPAPTPAASAGTGGTGSAGTAGTGGSGGAAGESDVGSCKTADTCAADFKKEGAAPPAKPADAPAAGEDLVQGLSKLYVGDTDRKNDVSADAWKDIGFDIDGWTSTTKQGFHCKPQAGGKNADIRPDGNKGIDNSFGKNIVNGILITLVSDPSNQISKGIADGSFSIVLKMDKAGTAASATGVKTQLFPSAGTKDGDKAVAPGDDWSNYEWHPYEEIVNADGSSKIKFDEAYIVNNTWVSGGKGSLSLQLNVQGYNLALDINQAQLAVDLSADRKTGTNGTIGGVLATTQLVDALKKIAGNFGASFCGDGSSALQGILDSVKQSSDIMKDGTQNPDAECDGISIGLGFDSKVTKLGDKAPPSVSKDP